MALAAGGREVSLEDIALWRKNGLLPPLGSRGIRIQGRSYCWYEPDILPRAELVYDALQKHGKSEQVTLCLWLHGFEVQPSRFRRAWLNRARMAGPARLRFADGTSRSKNAPQTLPELLLTATLQAAASIECTPAPFIPVLRRASAALGYAPGSRDGEAQSYWQAAMAMLLALDSSDTVSGASDQEMLEAQHHLHIALTFLSGYCRNESPAAMVEALGPALFLFILALQRSGQQGVIGTAMERIAAARRADVTHLASAQHGIREPSTLPALSA
jgi:hypothetical protein